ncbi:MAG TPA: serine/threonine-protein kinase [Planctomycetota bacterium]|nr:serine/threonine-protein kinase [Planctomycetota bacterium]
MTWTRERWARIEALFHDVAQRDVADRASHLAVACGGDDELHAAVLRLLAADGADDLLDEGVAVALRGKDPLLQAQFGPFRLVERIADGGMGTVYRAHRVHGDFEQEAAVKVLRLGLLTDSMRDRFARERQTLARLVHPNVARLLDGGTTDQGVPFFAMEFIDGVPVDRFCDEQKATVRQRLSLFTTICRAVHFAHQNLIVHLDLKPSNILVDEHGVPKLLDFGVAGLLEGVAQSTAAATATRSRPLTPEYASPELLRGEPVSTAADVYSLGIVLYELLAGTRPFRPTRSDLKLLRAVCETDALRPSTTFAEAGEQDVAASRHARAERRSSTAGEMVRSLRGDLDRIVAKAMRKEPDRRYASCQEFAEDVERHLRGFPVAAREASVGYRASKFVRRNLVLVLAAAAVLLALLGGIAATLHMASVAEAERDVATAARRQVEHEVEHARIEATSSSLTASFLSDTILSSTFLTDSQQRANVLETIERKAAQVRAEYAGREHLCANLLDALGRACASFDAFEPAEALIREAAAIRLAQFGKDSLEQALSLGSLGRLFYTQGRLAEALDALRERYRLHKQCPIDVHTDVALAANDLAAAERAAGNRERARELHLEALALRRAGGDPVLVAESLNNLANSEPDLKVARAHLEEALRLRREVLGPDDALTIQTSTNLGSLAITEGDFAAAQRLLRDAVAQHRRLGGLGVDGLAVALRSLAYAELRQGESGPARAAIDEALTLDRQRLGPSHLRVASDLEVRANIEAQDGALPAAVETWREVLRVRRAALPEGHRQIALTQCSLGAALARAGRVPEAIAVLGEASANQEAALPAAAADLVDTKVHLADAFERAGDMQAAEQQLLAALQLCTDHGEAAVRAGLARGRLRAFYERRDRPADAARFAEPEGTERHGR